MKTKTLNFLTGVLLFLGSMLLFTACSSQSTNSSASTIDSKVDSVLSLMTLKEKIGQMNQYSTGSEMTGPTAGTGGTEARYNRFINGEVGSVLNLLGAEETYKLQKLVVEKTRLGIPLVFAYDVIHGYKTIFPIPLAESASWDLDLMEQTAKVAAKEAASAGVQWTFAPMVDVTRDARWGRVMEGAGEDPYLGAEIAKARIKGFQGDDLSDEFTIAGCAKHFAGYGFVEAGKDYNSTEIGRNTLYNVVLRPFEVSANADVATFMNAFNDLDGIPSTGSQFLVNETLHGKWNYDGAVVSDWNSVGEMVNHGVAKDEYRAAELAVNAGCDIDMEADAYIENLERLVAEGKVKESTIDESVRRILKLKFKLGLFDDPYKYCDVEREKATLLHADHVKLSRDIAAKSIVLLKNENNLLPLNEQKRVGVIGPLAKDKDTPLGNWRGSVEANSAVSFYEGLEAAIGENTSIQYAEGCKLSIGPNSFPLELVIEENDRSGFKEARRVAKNSEVVFMVLGEPAYMSGEARSRAEIGLPGLQLELLQEVYKVNKNIVLVLMNGRPLTIPWEAENIPTILETWHLGLEAGNAIADVITGKVNPSGKLPMTFPRKVGQLPMYYNHLNTGRPESNEVFYVHQMDVDHTPLYPFGFGLSYTSFSYSDLKVEASEGQINVSVTVTNSGKYDGEEVAQLYIRDLEAIVSRPVMELKAFEKVYIPSGQSKELSFTLSKGDLSFYNPSGQFVFEPGEFEIFVGGSSDETLSKTVGL